MSYTPTNWTTGDTITAEKLNKMEQGIASAGGGGGVLIVTIDENNALDHTWKEISDNKFAVLDDDFFNGRAARELDAGILDVLLFGSRQRKFAEFLEGNHFDGGCTILKCSQRAVDGDSTTAHDGDAAREFGLFGEVFIAVHGSIFAGDVEFIRFIAADGHADGIMFVEELGRIGDDGFFDFDARGFEQPGNVAEAA